MKKMLIGTIKVAGAYMVACIAGYFLLAGGITQFTDGLNEVRRKEENR